MKFQSKHLLTLVGALTCSVTASATPILQQRCSSDSLDIYKAADRIEWARKCGLVNNSGGTGAFFDTGMMAANGGQLYDYSELQVGPYGRLYSGDLQGYDVNSTYVFSLYLSANSTQSVDTLGFYKWTRPDLRKRARPLYPTFGTSPDINSGAQIFPHPTLANCTLYSDPNGITPVGAFYVNGYCEASCYAPDQKVLFSDGPQSIRDARLAMREDLVTLTSDSTLDTIKLENSQTYSFTEEIRDADHTLVEITTQSGGKLRVTEEHPVIQGEGRIVQAQTLKVGDELVKVDGSHDPIVDVQKTRYFGKVYNVRPVSEDLVNNILVAEGYLVGSSRYQNDDVAYINRIILYRSPVPESVLP
ncbi:Hint domain-containing protein [Archangium gephyra]|uniref:Hint domain-containing protein n=1 Tax=Archangium gephyra TaxID=48 RepID=UPI0035D41E72